MTLATSPLNSLKRLPPGTLRNEARLELARRSLLHFTKFTFPDYQANWHHRYLCSVLDRFVAGDIPRLIVLMPPRHGKSELVSRRLPAYILGRDPNARIISASYGADLASRMNRDVQRIIDSTEYHEIFPNTTLFGSNVRTVGTGTYLRNSDIFEVVGYRGTYRSAGIGGGITGMGFDFGIIDDPIKNREEADSSTYREQKWRWYASTFYPRQEANARILITETPWHPDDIVGRLTELSQGDTNADKWMIVRFPAIADDHLCDGDPRALGEPLWPDKYDIERLGVIRDTVGTYEWNALYQCEPRPSEGNMFKRSWFEVVDAAPALAQRVRYWDKAGTENDGAYTVGLLMAYDTTTGLFYIEDVVRGQWGATERARIERQTAELDDQKYGRGMVRIFVEQEPGSGGKESAEATIRNLVGHSVKADRPTGNKLRRLDGFEAQAGAGNVKLVRGPWNAPYLDEMCSIPNSIYMDQGDGTSGAFNALIGRQQVGWHSKKRTQREFS